MTVADTIATMTAQLQAQRKGTLQDRLAAVTDRPRPARNVDDPEFWRHFNAQSGIVEGDDGEVVEVVKRRRRQPIIPDAVEPNQPVTLATAVHLFFPDGSMTVSGLRNEIAKRNLRASKMSGQIYVTKNDITRMIELCTIGADDQAKEHGSTCESEPVETDDGSFSTSHQPASASSAAQAHLSEIVQRLKQPLPNTSRKSTSPTLATVTRLKF